MVPLHAEEIFLCAAEWNAADLRIGHRHSKWLHRPVTARRGQNSVAAGDQSKTQVKSAEVAMVVPPKITIGECITVSDEKT